MGAPCIPRWEMHPKVLHRSEPRLDAGCRNKMSTRGYGRTWRQTRQGWRKLAAESRSGASLSSADDGRQPQEKQWAAARQENRSSKHNTSNGAQVRKRSHQNHWSHREETSSWEFGWESWVKGWENLGQSNRGFDVQERNSIVGGRRVNWWVSERKTTSIAPHSIMFSFRFPKWDIRKSVYTRNSVVLSSSWFSTNDDDNHRGIKERAGPISHTNGVPRHIYLTG